jgi:hypothetical protein
MYQLAIITEISNETVYCSRKKFQRLKCVKANLTTSKRATLIKIECVNSLKLFRAGYIPVWQDCKKNNIESFNIIVTINPQPPPHKTSPQSDNILPVS